MPDGPGAGRILDVVGKALEPIYGFRSLATFKSRFKPDYRTLYLYYQDPLHLPAMGRALSRAYLPGLSVRQSARLLQDPGALISREPVAIRRGLDQRFRALGPVRNVAGQ